MSATVRDILAAEFDQKILFDAFECYINKCKGIAKHPTRGYNPSQEEEKKQEWADKAESAQQLLSNLMNELI